MRYPSRSAAKAAMKRVIAAGMDADPRGLNRPLGTFPCPHCEMWHFGHSTLNVKSS